MSIWIILGPIALFSLGFGAFLTRSFMQEKEEGDRLTAFLNRPNPQPGDKFEWKYGGKK